MYSRAELDYNEGKRLVISTLKTVDNGVLKVPNSISDIMIA